MCCPVHDFFKLVFGVIPNNALDNINKGLRFAQTLTKKGFEFVLANEYVGFILYFPLMLLPAKQGNILKKDSNKWYSI